MGALPSAVTTAEPLWVPFRVRAGTEVAPDPRETHFAELRRLTTNGKAGAPVWDEAGAKILVPDAGTCRSVATIDLAAAKGVRQAYSAPIAAVTASGAASVCNDAQAEIPPCWPAAGLVGRTVTMVSDAFDCRWDKASAYNLSAAGGRVAYIGKSGADLDVFTAAADGSGAARVTSGGANASPRLSPDGSSVTWAHRGKDGELHVWVADANGARPRQVTRDAKDDAQPTFLPDSREILYASDRDSAAMPPHFSLYRVDPDGPLTASGGPRVERVTFAEGVDAAPAFSPDGRWLAFLSSRGDSAGLDLYVARWRE